MNQEIDLSLAIQLQAQFEEELRVRLLKENDNAVKLLEHKGFSYSPKNKELPEPTQNKLSVSLIDSCWELLDPTPDIHCLFLTFNDQFFWGRLAGVEVKWSPRMTVCAGICRYEGRSGLCSIGISTPLLKLRPRKDLVETLLHEMIHAYLFVTHNNRDHDGHGPNFHRHMHRINNLAGTKISVYHSFHDEVAVYKQHVWLCNGPCKKRPPYYGLVKRSMNRVPGPNDMWWAQHQSTCGGSFTKIKEPEGFGQKKRKLSEIKKGKDSSKDIRKFFPPRKKAEPNKRGDTKSSSNTQGPPAPKKGSSSSSSNVSTIGSSSTRVGVTSLDIQNASNSNVHGFGKGHQGASSSGNYTSTGKENIPGKGNNNRFGGGTATAQGSGSRTVTVPPKKGKNHTKTSPQKDPQITTFSGSGYTLGAAPRSTIPRRNISNAFHDSPQRQSSKTNTTMGSSSSNSHSEMGQCKECPLCSSSVPDSSFEDHITECLGEFSDEEPNSKDGGSVSWGQTCPEVLEISSDEDQPKSSRKQEEKHLCPICHDLFPSSFINEHANSHF